MIMHKSNSRCNPNFEKFFDNFARASNNENSNAGKDSFASETYAPATRTTGSIL